MAEPDTTEPDGVMETRRFLSHPVCVHMMRKHLTEIFDQQQHWVFAMTAECGELALKLNALHAERCGTNIELVVGCCVEGRPAFLLFPRARLSFYEIGELLDIAVTHSQEEAERMHYFTLSMGDPKPLSDALQAWIHQDHLMS